jgi:hypothetical protein
MIQNITAITLATPNMSRAIRFYRMLGFEIGYLNLIAHLPSEIGLGGDVLSSTIPTLTPSMRVIAAGYRPDISPPQSPVPGFGDNKLALSGLSSHSFASGGGSRFTVMFGQTRAYSALMPSHSSSPASVSGLIASTGHSGSQTPQSMHSSGWMTSMFSPS